LELIKRDYLDKSKPKKKAISKEMELKTINQWFLSSYYNLW